MSLKSLSSYPPLEENRCVSLISVVNLFLRIFCQKKKNLFLTIDNIVDYECKNHWTTVPLRSSTPLWCSDYGAIGNNRPLNQISEVIRLSSFIHFSLDSITGAPICPLAENTIYFKLASTHHKNTNPN